MDYLYLITPFATWLVTGSIKFLISSLLCKRFALDKIGYGGFPSNHSAIVTSIVVLVALEEGIENPAFGVAITFAFIVILDAFSLRRQVGLIAQAVNAINLKVGNPTCLRERVGHTVVEIVAGIVVGSCVAMIFLFF